MATDHRKEETQEHDGQDPAGLKPSDAAVRRALVEAHQELVAFLRRRLHRPEEAEEVLQRFAVRALERAAELRNVHTVRGWLGRF